MSSENVSRQETTTQVVRFARFSIICTLAFAAVLLVAQMLTNGRLGLLTESTLTSLLYVIGLESVAAIAAATCLSLWKKPE